MGVPKNGWFLMETPIKMDDWGLPLFKETSMCFPFENVGVSIHGVPQNGWFIVEHPIKRDDLGGALFQETSIYIQSLKIYIYIHMYQKIQILYASISP